MIGTRKEQIIHGLQTGVPMPDPGKTSVGPFKVLIENNTNTVPPSHQKPLTPEAK